MQRERRRLYVARSFSRRRSRSNGKRRKGFPTATAAAAITDATAITVAATTTTDPTSRCCVAQPRRQKHTSVFMPVGLGLLLLLLLAAEFLPEVAVEGTGASDGQGGRESGGLWIQDRLGSKEYPRGGNRPPPHAKEGSSTSKERRDLGWGRGARKMDAACRHEGRGIRRRRAVEAELSPADGWLERKRAVDSSMRETIELAKADARAVRAAARDAAAAAAAAADTEAAWAACGAGSGGGKGDNAMLFLACEVNGRTLRAFVDTGAQVTVMSRACAERCGLTSRIDRRFRGRAVGVGFTKILGKIHDARIRIGNADLTCSFTVIEHGEIDLLVGLDVLRAHRCDISLSRNRMRFDAAGGSTEVAFLTRVEGDGTWTTSSSRRRRWRRRRSSAYGKNSLAVDGSVPIPASAESQHHGNDDYGYENDLVREYEAPPPRVLRELARGTRGDGVPTDVLGRGRGRRVDRCRFGDDDFIGDTINCSVEKSK